MTMDRRERVARAIYDKFQYDGGGSKPVWQMGGNSLKQDDARKLADAAIESIQDAEDIADGEAALDEVERDCKIAGLEPWEDFRDSILLTRSEDLMAQSIEGQFGKRCPEFCPGCICCEAWRQYDKRIPAPPSGGE